MSVHSSPSVLIIGGTGLISTGIVKALLARQARVTVLNRGKTERRFEAARAGEASGEGVEVLHGDRNDFGTFERMFEGKRYDAVIDMIGFNKEQAESDVRAFGGRTGHFIFCSTVCTYGNTQTVMPTTEATVQRPHSKYGREKVEAELVLMEAHEAGKMPVTIMRPAHTYGPGGGVINNLGWGRTFVDRLRKGKPIVVSGDGHGLWQSAYCDDVGVGFAAAVGRKSTFGEAYNIVGDKVVTWDEYTRATARAIGAPQPRIVHVPTDFLMMVDAKRYEPLDEIFRYHAVYSNEKIWRDVPEYKVVTPYEEGVRRTVAWMDANGMVVPDSEGVEDRIVEALEGARKTVIEGLLKKW